LQIRRPQITNLENGSTQLGSASAYPTNDLHLQVEAWNVRSDLNWTHRFNPTLKLDTKLGIDYTDTSRVSNFQGFTADTQAEQAALIRTTNESDKFRVLKSKGKILSQAHEQHSITFGWDGASENSNTRQLQSDTLNLSETPLTPRETSSVKVQNLAFFAQDEWDLSPSVQLVLGLRWESIRINIQGSSVLDTSKHFSVWNPVLQTLWKVAGSSDDQVRLAFSRAYNPPNLNSLAPLRRIRLDDNSPAQPDVQGNPHLEPELANNLDLSYEHNLGKMRASASLVFSSASITL